MAQGLVSQVNSTTISMVTSHSAIFLASGMNEFRGIAVCLVVWEGFKVAFHMQPANRIAGLLVSIAMIYSALSFYSAPFPGVGKNLTQIVTDAGTDLAETIDTTIQESVGVRMADDLGDTSGSMWGMIQNPGSVVRYLLFFFALSALQVAVLGIIGFGYVAVGVLVLLGPILIPFFLVPGFDWMATGWMRSLIEYSFYPVVGNAVVYVYSVVLMNFFSSISQPVDSTVIAASLTKVVILSLACVFGILKIPALVSSIFSGHSGLSSMPSIGWWR